MIRSMNVPKCARKLTLEIANEIHWNRVLNARLIMWRKEKSLESWPLLAPKPKKRAHEIWSEVSAFFVLAKFISRALYAMRKKGTKQKPCRVDKRIHTDRRLMFRFKPHIIVLPVVGWFYRISHLLLCFGHLQCAWCIQASLLLFFLLYGLIFMRLGEPIWAACRLFLFRIRELIKKKHYDSLITWFRKEQKQGRCGVVIYTRVCSGYFIGHRYIFIV